MNKTIKICLAIAVVLLLAVCVYAGFLAKNIAGITFITTNGEISQAQLRGETYTVTYVYPQYLGVLYGRAYGKVAEVRKDLPPHMSRFVLYHEIYHLQDNDFSSKVMREVRANLAAAIYEPLGFAQTVWSTLCDTGRLKFYWNTY